MATIRALSPPCTLTEDGPLSTKPGVLTVIVGCMFSGKTTTLLGHVARYPAAQVCAIKPTCDKRYDHRHFVSHSGAKHPCALVPRASEIPNFLNPQTRCLAIDEGHFFSDSMIDLLAELCKKGLECVVVGLDRNSWGRPFPHIQALLRMSDRPVIRRAKCGRCGGIANRTQRLTPIRQGKLIGGVGDYEPRCARCWQPPPETPPDQG